MIRHRVSLEADLGVPQGLGHHSDQIKDIELLVKAKIDCDDGQDNAVAALV